MSSAIADFLLPAPDLDQAENPRRIIRAGLISVALFGAFVGLWASLAPVGGAAIAPGFVKVDMNRRTVQHQEGGIVGEILVRDGTRVKAGQTLITLKDVRVDASNELVKTQLDAELAKQARLAAEQLWAREIAFPRELVERRDDARVAELLHREAALFRARRSAYENQVALIRQQIGETREELKVRGTQLEADATAIRLQRQELAQNLALEKEGYVSKTRLLTLERGVAELEGRRGENQSELARARQRIVDLELRAETLRTTFMQEAASEYRQTAAQVFDLQERLRPAKDAEERQRIVAPIDGEVVDLKFTSVGQVIGPRDPILDIVPDDADLIVEAQIRTEDISYVKSGADADVRLTSFRQRITPTVQGKVLYLSADRLQDKQANTTYYIARIRIDPESLRHAGDLRLQAGMPAEVFIRTTPRSTFQYFLDPLAGFRDRSMRQP